MAFRAGFPSISVPRNVDRDTAAAVTNIRQRLAQLDAEVQRIAALQENASPSSSGAAVDLSGITTQINALTARIDALEAGSSTVTAWAAEALTDRSPVALMADSSVAEARANSVDRAFAFYGVVLGDVANGAQATIQRTGQVSIPGGGFIDQRPVFLGSTGGFTQSPTGAAVPVGVAVSSTMLLISPSLAALMSSPWSDVDDSLPVTYGMVKAAIELAASVSSQAPGILVKVADNTVRSRVLIGGRYIDVVHQDGLAGDPIIDYNPSSPTGYPP